MAVTISMKPSRLNTMVVPLLGKGNAATIWIAADRPMRIVVRNVGPSTIFIAHTSDELAKVGASSGVYILGAALSETFVLAPAQGIYCAALGASGKASVAISEAIPMFLES